MVWDMLGYLCSDGQASSLAWDSAGWAWAALAAVSTAAACCTAIRKRETASLIEWYRASGKILTRRVPMLSARSHIPSNDMRGKSAGWVSWTLAPTMLNSRQEIAQPTCGCRISLHVGVSDGHRVNSAKSKQTVSVSLIHIVITTYMKRFDMWFICAAKYQYNTDYVSSCTQASP